MKNILLTGATGMIGTALQPLLTEYRLWCLMRRDPKPGELVHGQALRSVAELGEPIDAVINLAGENIGARRWSATRKQALRDSRIAFTRKLIDELGKTGQRPAVWINASAVGYYGNRPGELLTEEASAGADFAATLCADWEAAATQALPLCERQVIFRLGVVMGPAGVLAKLRLPFSLGLGAIMGPGRQFMPWISLEDVCAVIKQALGDARFSGPVNLVAPGCVDQAQFARALAKQLHRPLLFRFPAPLLRILMGEMSDLLLVDQRVEPGRLREMGHVFNDPQLDQSLRRYLG
jgi:uncharacterized protein